jgi:hypothetical protein
LTEYRGRHAGKHHGNRYWGGFGGHNTLFLPGLASMPPPRRYLVRWRRQAQIEYYVPRSPKPSPEARSPPPKPEALGDDARALRVQGPPHDGRHDSQTRPVLAAEAGERPARHLCPRRLRLLSACLA